MASTTATRKKKPKNNDTSQSKQPTPPPDPTGTIGQILNAIGSIHKPIGQYLTDLVEGNKKYLAKDVEKGDELRGVNNLIPKSTQPKSADQPPAKYGTPPSYANADLTNTLSQYIGNMLAPYANETQGLLSKGDASFESMMAPQMKAAFQQNEPAVRAANQQDVAANTNTSQGAPALDVMTNLLGQMQNRALYYGLPLSQVYGNVTNPFLHALMQSPTLQGLSSSSTAGSTQIGPNTYSTQPTKPAGGYPTSLPNG